MTHDSWQSFGFSQLNSLLSWAFSRQVETLWILDYVDCVPFPVLILSILFKPTHLTKSYSQISEKYDQTSINLTNVFDFRGKFSNYFAFDEIRWSCALTKYTRQKFIIKHDLCLNDWLI